MHLNDINNTEKYFIDYLKNTFTSFNGIKEVNMQKYENRMKTHGWISTFHNYPLNHRKII